MTSSDEEVKEFVSMEDFERYHEKVAARPPPTPPEPWSQRSEYYKNVLTKYSQDAFRWFCSLTDPSFLSTLDVGCELKEDLPKWTRGALGIALTEPTMFKWADADKALSLYSVNASVEETAEDMKMDAHLTALAILEAWWRCAARVSIDWAPLLSFVECDESCLHQLMRFVETSPEGHPQEIVLQLFMPPVMCCVLLSLAHAEAKAWLARVDWHRVHLPEYELTQDQLDGVNELIRTTVDGLTGVHQEDKKDVAEALKIQEAIKRELNGQTIDFGKLRSTIGVETNKMNEMRDSLKKQYDDLIRQMEGNPQLQQIPDMEQAERDEIIHEVSLIREATAELGVDKVPLAIDQLGVLDFGHSVLARRNDELRTSFMKGTVAGPAKMMPLDAQNVESEYVSGYPIRFSFHECSEVVDVPLHNIARDGIDLTNCKFPDDIVGARVVAETRNKECIGFYAGTLGEAPCAFSSNDVLIFFDCGTEDYVAPKTSPVYLMCHQATRPRFGQNGQVVSMTIDRLNAHSLVKHNLERAHFLRNYLAHYPANPMVIIRKRQIGEYRCQALNHLGMTRSAVVMHVDRKMCTLRFFPRNITTDKECRNPRCTEGETHGHTDARLYRGSWRLQPMWVERDAVMGAASGAAAAGARPGCTAATPRTRQRRGQHTFTMRDMVETLAAPIDPYAQTKTGKMTARKSSMADPRELASAPMRAMREKEQYLLRQREKMFQLLDVREDGSQRTYVFHENCTRDCLRGLDRDPCWSSFHRMSPFFIPIKCGWERLVYSISGRKRTKRRLMYRAPCGRNIANMAGINAFLRETHCELTIDLFTFDIQLRPHMFLSVSSEYKRMDDYTDGKEGMELETVNTVDKQPPPVMEHGYSERRFAENSTVDQSTVRKEFCSGCECQDDCSDLSKCACRQLTRDAANHLAKALKPSGRLGYHFRTITEVHMSGLYECNDNCSCNRKRCFNRVVQQPIKVPIQLFKTATCGWGVRAMCDLPAGYFISNYAGALLTDDLAEQSGKNMGDEYYADLDLYRNVENQKEQLGVHLLRDQGIDVEAGEEEREGEGRRPGSGRTRSMSAEHSESDESDDGLGEEGGDDGSADEEKNEDKEEKEKEKEEGGRVEQAELTAEEQAVHEERERAMEEDARQEVEVDNASRFDMEKHFENRKQNFLFVIDAKRKGNLGRFLNHSCDPNVFVQYVFVDTHDIRLPWVAFFTKRYIPAGEELCWDYQYAESETGMKCNCGANNCRGRLR